MARRLLQLEHAVERLRPYRRRYVGVRPIDVGSIIGTEGRGDDFDAGFSPLKPHLRERARLLARTFPTGSFPPVSVEKLGEAYFVVDGHHRVALARRLGMVTIDAEVTELTARWHLSASADCEELRHAEQERRFMTESGLAEAHPDARIRFTRAVGYRQLLETIQVHGYGLMLDAEGPLPRGEVAEDWYASVYLPTVELAAVEKLRACRGATDSDRFLWLWEQRRELSIEHGGSQLTDVVRLAAAGRRRLRLRPRRA